MPVPAAPGALLAPPVHHRLGRVQIERHILPGVATELAVKLVAAPRHGALDRADMARRTGRPAGARSAPTASAPPAAAPPPDRRASSSMSSKHSAPASCASAIATVTSPGDSPRRRILTGATRTPPPAPRRPAPPAAACAHSSPEIASPAYGVNDGSSARNSIRPGPSGTVNGDHPLGDLHSHSLGRLIHPPT